MELHPYEGLQLTVEEIRLAELIKAKREELLHRREQEELLQQQLEVNATRVMPIRVAAARPEQSRADAPTSGADSGLKEGLREKEKPKPSGDSEAKEGAEAWTYKRKSAPSTSAPQPSSEAVVGKVPAAGAEAEESAPIAREGAQKYMSKKRRVVPREELDETVFPVENLLLSRDWNPSSQRLEAGPGPDFVLSDLGPDGNQTLAMKISVPADSTRWAFNVCPPEHDGWKEMVFHFNPRRFKREELLLNSRTEGIWRKNDTIPLSDLPSLFGSNSRECTLELVVQVREQGFFVFHNRNYLCHFPHRREIHSFR